MNEEGEVDDVRCDQLLSDARLAEMCRLEELGWRERVMEIRCSLSDSERQRLAESLAIDLLRHGNRVLGEAVELERGIIRRYLIKTFTDLGRPDLEELIQPARQALGNSL